MITSHPHHVSETSSLQDKFNTTYGRFIQKNQEFLPAITNVSDQNEKQKQLILKRNLTTTLDQSMKSKRRFRAVRFATKRCALYYGSTRTEGKKGMTWRSGFLNCSEATFKHCKSLDPKGRAETFWWKKLSRTIQTQTDPLILLSKKGKWLSREATTS